MWPKLLDLTHDECRGRLRRLELESYSNVVGAFRAQGSLSAAKARILKDLREAFHISDDRHKAEVRRVVNDESLSTIAKMIHGPNSEIEWNKEGSRGFLIIDRKPPQTALSIVADDASRLGEALNKELEFPAETTRFRVLHESKNVNDSNKTVTSNPEIVRARIKKEEYKPAIKMPMSTGGKRLHPLTFGSIGPRKREGSKLNVQIDSPATKVNIGEQILSPKPESPQLVTDKRVTSNSRRRKSTTTVMTNTPRSKAPMLWSRRDTISGFGPVESIHIDQEQRKSHNNENQGSSHPREIREFHENLSSSTQMQRSIPIPRIKSSAVSSPSAKIETSRPEPAKYSRAVPSMMAQSSSVVKVLDTKIIKNPTVTLSNVYVAQPPHVQSIKVSPSMKSTPYTSTNNVEYLAMNDCNRLLKQVKAHKIQVITSGTPTTAMPSNVNIHRAQDHHMDDITPIPTVRTPNIVKTNANTMMHVTPMQPNRSQTQAKSIINAQPNYSPRPHLVQIVSPQTIQPRTVTIHPNSTIVEEDSTDEIYEDQEGNWHEYDSIDSPPSSNGYVIDNPNNGHDYENHISESIIYDDDIITEEYITTDEFNLDNVIEVDIDSVNYSDGMIATKTD